VKNVLNTIGARKCGSEASPPGCVLADERLMPYVYNPRLHTKADYDTLAAVMLALGWAISVLVDKEGVPPAEMGRIPVS